VKIAIVHPPQKYLVAPCHYPPTGAAYVVSCIRAWAADIVEQCDLLDLAGHTEDEALEAIKGYDIVGYSVVSSYWKDTLSLATKNIGNAYQIVGGAHTTITGETAPCFQTQFIGRAEKSIITFLRDFAAGCPKKLYNAEVIPLDDIPYPLFRAGKKLNYLGAERTAVIFSGRGCTHRCAFCAARAMYKGVEFRSTDNVVGEVDKWIERGITEFRFMDDAFTVSRPRVEKLCELFKPRHIRWACMVRVDQVDQGLLGKMKDAGCSEVAPGIESFDQDVLDAYEKQTTVAQNVSALHEFHEEGLHAHVFFLVSGPGEKYKKTIDLNIEAMERLKNKYARLLFSVMMPHPGTPIANNPAKYGVEIIEKDCSKYTQHQFLRIDGVVKKLEPWFPLRVLSMTSDQQMENLVRMREYMSTQERTLYALPGGGMYDSFAWSKAHKE